MSKISENRRNFLKKTGILIATGASASIASGMQNIQTDKGTVNGDFLTIPLPENGLNYSPLDQIAIQTSIAGDIQVFDGQGRMYHSANSVTKTQLNIGGSLGNHAVFLLDKNKKLIDFAVFKVDCRTNIEDESGEFTKLAQMLEFEINQSSYAVARVVRLDGKQYHCFSSWFQDHMYVMQAQKYFYPELKSGIDLYFKGQREDGMFHDNFKHKNEKEGSWSLRFDYGNFVKVPDDPEASALFVRVPLENIAEYSMIEGTYFTWKATGDHHWMSQKLDMLIKGVQYITTDPYRWSEKFQLVKKGYSIDIWDFQNEYDAALVGGDTMKIELGKTPFGVLFADNVRLAYSCHLLAEMLDNADRRSEANDMRKLGQELKEKVDQLAWNGRHYTHWIPENPERKYNFGVDESAQVTLSNAYALNHGATPEQCKAIIATYKQIRVEMPSTSPGEWYCCYPPFKKGWGSHNEWTYMNGGVSPITAGQLAKGAFENGDEAYGIDILRRVYQLVKKNGGRILGGYRGAFPETPVRSFEPVSLLPIANADTHGTGGPGIPGFTGEGQNDLSEFPSGNQTFEGVPFMLIDPVDNNRKACLILSGEKGYTTQASLLINKKAASIYFISASSNTQFPGYIKFQYQDNEEWSKPVDINLSGNWWFPEVKEVNTPMSKIAWRGGNKKNKNIGVYVSGINNPFPDKTISSISFHGPLDKGKWIILGLTLSDQPAFFMPVHVNTIPTHWAAAECYYALMEGLAGVNDTGVAFDKIRVAPRWFASDCNSVKVSAKYEASGGYVSYKLIKHTDKLQMIITGNFSMGEVEILLPEGFIPKVLTVNGMTKEFKTKKVENSQYLITQFNNTGVYDLTIN